MKRSQPVSLRLAGAVLLLAAAGMAGGCRARPPGTAERAVMGHIKRHITVGGRSTVNPLPATEENIERGWTTFATSCKVCHGFDGRTTGVIFAEAMSPPVPHLDSPDVQQYTDGQLKWIIENGLSPSGMPAFRNILSDEEMWRIVLFIRHLPEQRRTAYDAARDGRSGQR